MLKHLVTIFNKLPANYRALLKYKFQAITMKFISFKNIIQDLSVPVYASDEQTGLKVAFIGHNSVIPYMVNRIYKEKREIKYLHNIFIKNMNREIRLLSKNYDLIVSCLHRFYLIKYFSDIFLMIPFFVRQKLNLPTNKDELIQYIKTKGSQKEMNKIKRNRFISEVTKDKEIFKFFYEQMHKPFIKSRHDDAYIEPFENLIPILEEGELLMIKQNDQYVSGVLCRRRSNIYETLSGGVYRADYRLFRDGALAAAYYFSIERAIGLGCKFIDFGRTRAFLNDGILHFKNKWNAETIMDYKSIRNIGLHICNLNKDTSNFLEDNPFILIKDKYLEEIIFLGDNISFSDKELQSYLKYRNIRGIDSISLVLLSSKWVSKQDMLVETGQKMNKKVRIIAVSQERHEEFRSHSFIR